MNFIVRRGVIINECEGLLMRAEDFDMFMKEDDDFKFCFKISIICVNARSENYY